MISPDEEYRILHACNQSLNKAFDLLNEELKPKFEGDDYLTFSPFTTIDTYWHDEHIQWTVFQQVKVNRHKAQEE